MNDMEKLKKIIYSFYPKNVHYCSNKYEISYEYLQRKKIIWDKFNNSNYILKNHWMLYFLDIKLLIG